MIPRGFLLLIAPLGSSKSAWRTPHQFGNRCFLFYVPPDRLEEENSNQMCATAGHGTLDLSIDHNFAAF
jgi:hypothetical protein